MAKYKCDCCGFVADFNDSEAAYAAGWDAPPYFTGYVCCHLCPAVALLGLMDHRSIHEEWERTGRPEEFSQDTCVPVEQRVPQEELDEMAESIAKMVDDG